MKKQRRTTGGSAQDRRRERRAAERRRRDGVAELRPSDILEIRQLVAASLPSSESHAAELREIIGEAFGGRPSKGTKPDRRLKENKQPEQQLPEEAALEALDSYRAASEPDAREMAAAFVRARRPDLVGFEAEVEAVVRRVLAAAAGDVAWGLEEGFIDLLCDVNAVLSGDDEDELDYAPGPRAVDVSIKLDKVLISDRGDYYVAPITIDDDEEPVLSDRSEWLYVESGWIEGKPDDDDDSMVAGARLRFALRDLILTFDGATAPPLPVEHEPAEVLPEPSAEPIPAPSAQTGGPVAWQATFVPEAVLTEDGRAFAPDALILPPEDGSRELPLTLMAMIETSAEGGHDGAKVAGRIDQLWREAADEGPVQLVKASGVFSDEEFGQMIARMVDSKELTGLSVDIAPLEWEHGPRSDWFDEDGNWIAQRSEDGEWQPAGEPPSLEDAVDRLFGGDDMILVITKGVIGMATVCPFPAFGQASIALAASAGVPLYRYEAETDLALAETLTASVTALESARALADEAEAEAKTEEATLGLTAAAAGLAPSKPPAEWFEDPELGELTPLTITDDGRVYGHAWEWETCHLSFDECVVAPRSETNYAYFMLGELESEDDERLAVGKITLDTRHAGQRLSRAEATRHYDDTGTVAAYVVFGEDEHGGWFAGALSPELEESKIRVLRGATISGDWRGVDGNLELIALLAVNVPGFPVPRAPKALTAAAGSDPAEVVTLTAAGIVTKGLTVGQHAELASLLGEVVPAAEE